MCNNDGLNDLGRVSTASGVDGFTALGYLVGRGAGSLGLRQGGKLVSEGTFPQTNSEVCGECRVALTVRYTNDRSPSEHYYSLYELRVHVANTTVHGEMRK